MVTSGANPPKGGRTTVYYVNGLVKRQNTYACARSCPERKRGKNRLTPIVIEGLDKYLLKQNPAYGYKPHT